MCTMYGVHECFISSITCLLWMQYLRMKAAQLQSSAAQYLYEGTVGAGLPIISTLQGLLNTGDKIRRIEGIFR